MADLEEGLEIEEDVFGVYPRWNELWSEKALTL